MELDYQNLISAKTQHQVHCTPVYNKANELGELCTANKHDFLAITENGSNPTLQLSMHVICPNANYQGSFYLCIVYKTTVQYQLNSLW